MLNSKVRNSRTGFTLPEVLVAVAMVGVLSAVVLPSLVGQISKSEISRVVTDIQSIEQASQVFRADVGKWPGAVADLVTQPLSAGVAADGTTYGSGADQWDGPYLARADDLTNGLPTGAGGEIDDLKAIQWTDGSTDDADKFFGVEVGGLTMDEATLVSLTVDGFEATGTELDAGKVRYTSPSGPLNYLGAPLK